MNFEQAEKALRAGKSIGRKAWGGKVHCVKIDKSRKNGFRTDFAPDIDIFEFTQVVFTGSYFKEMQLLPEITDTDNLDKNGVRVNQEEKYEHGKFPRWNITEEDTQANDYYIV